MSKLNTSFVLGYHGCSLDTAKDVLLNKSELTDSKNGYDWLGHGIYFWEGDPKRAYEWAESKVKEGKYERIGVVGAIIDLGNCLDLTTRQDL